MSSSPGATVIKLLIACFLVGMLLRLLHITPANLLEHFGETIRRIFDLGVSLLHSVVSTVEWIIPYILLGAIIVIPIWLLRLGWHRARGGKS
ncbi:MAG TPA: DUF6460 domain-containing protein [Candidatus Cybelea sp.]|nr:DUF6460 domain-containing protein [Candidatus Cybelea sp.]